MSICGCPGSGMKDFRNDAVCDTPAADVPSQLRQWPIQLHLISPLAPYYQGADVVLAADCVAYTLGDFHSKFLKGKSLAIACPKLDNGQEIYVEKIKSWFDEAKINTLTVVIMQVPCCGGLVAVVKQAIKIAERKVPVKIVIIGLKGEILEDNWLD